MTSWPIGQERGQNHEPPPPPAPDLSLKVDNPPHLDDRSLKKPRYKDNGTPPNSAESIKVEARTTPSDAPSPRSAASSAESEPAGNAPHPMNFREKLFGGKRPIFHDLFGDDKEITNLEEDVVLIKDGPIPRAIVHDRVEVQLAKCWQNVVVVKLMAGRLHYHNYSTVLKKLQESHSVPEFPNATVVPNNLDPGKHTAVVVQPVVSGNSVMEIEAGNDELEDSGAEGGSHLRKAQPEKEQIDEEEESLWMQKANRQWNMDGDKNTTFYHCYAKGRRRRNRIGMLRNDAGEWVQDQMQLRSMSTEFFHNLYGASLEPYTTYRVKECFPELESTHIRALSREGRWRWEMFANALLTTALLKIASTMPPNPLVGKDSFYWAHDSKGIFTVRSAYGALMGDEQGGREASFFAHDHLDWMIGNLQNRLLRTEDWPLIFGVTAWKIWSWRNDFVFQNQDHQSFSKNREIWRKVRQVKDAIRHNRRMGATNSNKEIRMLFWKPPAGDRIKVNSDGAVSGDTGLASAGGAIRDRYGRWRGGFLMNIGYCSITGAEMWGLYQGLKLAWDLGYREVEVEVDNLSVVQMLSEGNRQPGSHIGLLRAIKELLSRSWVVKVNHSHRKCNMVADFLASLAATNPGGLTYLDSVSSEILPWFNHDIVRLVQFIFQSSNGAARGGRFTGGSSYRPPMAFSRLFSANSIYAGTTPPSIGLLPRAMQCVIAKVEKMI
ncbi:OLC1v1030878C1 [Oldenlandia corymbosa var. corymbosa]|uniref:OLC1v1030878C1 n=1 Tax=Oldenlandia corymbosa var. corymbosa TaxID=529605 RepID=A0AAV1CHV2_OLDCO|nr:OLC1v1030878C1 [Oldenlandia corymbosa var. corymbosa]